LIRVTTEAPNGKSKRIKRVVRDEKKVALAKLDDLKRELAAGLDTSKITVEDYMRGWLEQQRKLGKRAPQTLKVYSWAIDSHLAPALGGIQLAKLKTDQVETMLTDMRDNGASRETMRRVFMILNRAVEQAVVREKLDRNRVRGAVVPEPINGGNPSRAMTEEELRIFIDAIAGDDLELLYVLMLWTGLRPGEVCGLRWDDLELEGSEPLLHVRQALRLNPGGHWEYVVPKTAGSVRTLALAPELVARLRKHWTRPGSKALAEARLRAGSLWVDDNLVFASDTGRPILNLGRRMRNLCRDTGIGHWHPHELRHTWVTRCSESGVRIEALADAAGHSTTAMTEGTYRHADGVAGREASAAMSKLLR
jgi:integrase